MTALPHQRPRPRALPRRAQPPARRRRPPDEPPESSRPGGRHALTKPAPSGMPVPGEWQPWLSVEEGKLVLEFGGFFEDGCGGPGRRLPSAIGQMHQGPMALVEAKEHVVAGKADSDNLNRAGVEWMLGRYFGGQLSDDPIPLKRLGGPPAAKIPPGINQHNLPLSHPMQDARSRHRRHFRSVLPAAGRPSGRYRVRRGAGVGRSSRERERQEGGAVLPDDLEGSDHRQLCLIRPRATKALSRTGQSAGQESDAVGTTGEQ